MRGIHEQISGAGVLRHSICRLAPLGSVQQGHRRATLFWLLLYARLAKRPASFNAKPKHSIPSAAGKREAMAPTQWTFDLSAHGFAFDVAIASGNNWLP